MDATIIPLSADSYLINNHFKLWGVMNTLTVVLERFEILERPVFLLFQSEWSQMSSTCARKMFANDHVDNSEGCQEKTFL